MDVKEETLLGRQALAGHWYYVAKGRAVQRMLRGAGPFESVLDVSAGSGVFARRLLDHGMAQRALCVDPAYAAEHDEDHGGRPIRFRHAPDDETHQLVLMMDVLEHVEDDLGLLQAYADRLPAGGVAMITVPAFAFLWSGHDVFLEHRRRYRLGDVEALVRRAGLEVAEARYFFGLLFPVVATLRLIDRVRLGAGLVEPRSQLAPAPAMLNRALIAVHDLERAAVFPFNRLAGLSILCRAVKR